ncbi:gamma-glutamyl peptidase 3-like isoform X1 [Phoenix dactylifera]|uniref:Gamma-glutamyl peptidase 3-like isoform X1 n=1 Tax=Phoenix dactylifera TaxID=42345 RepID=A0A8B8ZZY9_PHODC|nr:gamma-glutamyl peptidase 3-like isoform X1 [Phoenix dactylifera]
MEASGKKRYALLLAAKDSAYVKKIYGGYFNVFVEAFGDEGETWDIYRVIDGEFPGVKELDGYDGFVISGSPHDAYGNDPWILRLCFLLQTLDAMQKRVLGICFGHQVLCRALGGRVGKAYGGWDIGVRKVSMMEDLSQYKFLQGLEEFPHSALIIECHQDEVWEVPSGAEVLAFSERTGVEMFAIGDHVLGIQGHPEYTKDILHNLIDQLANRSTIDRGFADDTKSRLEGAEPDRGFWEKVCKGFLKGRQSH